LIHFILFQNAFEIAIFVWIGITFGFDSCMMGQLYYPVTKLIIGVFNLGLCGFSTLPLYAIVTQLPIVKSNIKVDRLTGVLTMTKTMMMVIGAEFESSH
jgi:hypothetical protein